MLEIVLCYIVTHFSFSALRYFICTQGLQNICEKEAFDEQRKQKLWAIFFFLCNSSFISHMLFKFKNSPSLAYFIVSPTSVKFYLFYQSKCYLWPYFCWIIFLSHIFCHKLFYQVVCNMCRFLYILSTELFIQL